ncbi:aldehyde dehydrogenase family protein [Variovorax paradoxus]|nr:aldehyde dehydrogenase family protein [Variovorax paradoxus]MBT2304836.1 aldehyde dehydrogenase family protein [Variovorax paradoxus]
MTITRPQFLDERTKLLLIGGQWVNAASGETFDSINPSTGDRLATVALAGAEDIDRAVAAARAAFEGPWHKVKPVDRQRMLLKLADLVEAHGEELATLDSLDMGAPITRTLASRPRWVALLRYYAGLATAIHGDTIQNSLPGECVSYTQREPVGVVGGITPWNGPMVTSIWKIAPAIATGCTVILKPSEEACLSSLRLGALMLEAGIPAGVVNILPGKGDAGAALAAHHGVDKIAFTGSTSTGQNIIRAAAGNVKRLSLELGGKSPDIVFADADLDAAVPGAAMAVFGNTGQVCSAGTRLFIEAPVYDEFVERVAAYARTIRIGDSLDPQTQMGPLVSARQLERVGGYLSEGVREGATLVTGGARIEDGALGRGFFVPPTVFSNVKDDMRIAREEIFGPVISAIRFSDVDEVIRRGNQTMFGLGSGVWTRDLAKAHRVANGLRAGSVWVNCYQAMDVAIPFGGFKQSGYGRESGREHLDEYLETKSVVIKVA